METNSVGFGATTTATSPAAAVEKPKISSDFDTFLRMLTVQLKNQDPTNPIESSDYAVQLATFSGVEQQVQTNDLLRAMTAEQGATGLAQFAGWVGMEARAASPAHFDGSPLTIVPIPRAGADTAQLLVRSETGAEVQRIDIPLSGLPMAWAGVGADGSPLPSGNYRFDVVSYDGETISDEESAEVYSRVAEVRLKNGATSIVLAGGIEIAASDVKALRE